MASLSEIAFDLVEFAIRSVGREGSFQYFLAGAGTPADSVSHIIILYLSFLALSLFWSVEVEFVEQSGQRVELSLGEATSRGRPPAAIPATSLSSSATSSATSSVASVAASPCLSAATSGAPSLRLFSRHESKWAFIADVALSTTVVALLSTLYGIDCGNVLLVFSSKFTLL